MKRIWMVGVLALVVAAVAAAPAGAAGNSDNAQLCKKDGWKALAGGDGSKFANQGDCVSSVGHGGPIYQAASLELTLCENQPADGICVRATGTGLQPGTDLRIPIGDVTTIVTTIFTVLPSGSGGGTVAFSFAQPCVEGRVTTATATATSADSVSTPVVPGVTITSNTVSHTASCT